MKLRNMLSAVMGLETISPEHLNKLNTTNGVTVVDVNARQSWLHARVHGALNLDPAVYSESDLPEDKNAMLVFYCSNPMCRKALNAARKAEQMGYQDVKVMPAGIKGWLSAGLPVENGE